MLVYRFVTSKDTKIAFSGTAFGMCERKSISSLIKLLTCLRIGFERISIKLLNLCLSLTGPATIGRNCKSSGSLSSNYCDRVSLHLLLIKLLLWIFGNP